MRDGIRFVIKSSSSLGVTAVVRVGTSGGGDNSREVNSEEVLMYT